MHVPPPKGWKSSELRRRGLDPKRGGYAILQREWDRLSESQKRAVYRDFGQLFRRSNPSRVGRYVAAFSMPAVALAVRTLGSERAARYVEKGLRAGGVEARTAGVLARRVVGDVGPHRLTKTNPNKREIANEALYASNVHKANEWVRIPGMPGSYAALKGRAATFSTEKLARKAAFGRLDRVEPVKVGRVWMIRGPEGWTK